MSANVYSTRRGTAAGSTAAITEETIASVLTSAQILLPTPTFRERRHRGLACLGIAVRRALDVVPAMAARPHPGAALRRSRLQMEDAAHDLAVLQHVVVVLAPTRGVAALEDQRLGHQSSRLSSRWKSAAGAADDAYLMDCTTDTASLPRRTRTRARRPLGRSSWVSHTQPTSRERAHLNARHRINPSVMRRPHDQPPPHVFASATLPNTPTSNLPSLR